MAKKPTSGNNLSHTINNIKKDINSGFTELLTRVEALEASDKQHSMDIRDLQIQTRAARGDKQKTIAKDFDLSEGRVSQIINANR
jgi:DNA anti-recombination protein RmuC